MSMKKLLRTAQSHFGFLKNAKDDFYIHYRRFLRIPSEKFYHALPLIAERFSGCYVDVGANIGQSIESIKTFVPDAKIVSYEPNPNLATRLQRRYASDAAVSVRPVGLSDVAGSFSLYVPSYLGFVYDGLASLDRACASSWLSEDTIYGFRPERLSVQQYQCQVTTLDDESIENPILIKIDVQGTEFEVVKGGVNMIGKYKPILIIEDYHERPELIILAKELDYEPFHFDGQRFLPGPSNTSSFLMHPTRSEPLLSPR